jgi:hypothetical protein
VLTNRLVDSFLFIFLSMLILAASLYLPHHVHTIASRAWFYYAGDEDMLATQQGTAHSEL